MSSMDRADRAAVVARNVDVGAAESGEGVSTSHLGAQRRLSDVRLREEVELVGFDMPDELVEPLLERGILPGCRICPVRRSPSGDPIVLIDGTLVALRREMAGCLCVTRASAES